MRIANIHPAILLIVALVMFSCQAQKKVSQPAEWSSNAIWFGSGGGFTGGSTVYCLLENGQLFVKKGIAAEKYEVLAAVDKKQAKAIFKSAGAVNWASYQLNEPGNMYKELAYGKPGAETKLVWADGNAKADSKITDLYKQLFSLLKN